MSKTLYPFSAKKHICDLVFRSSKAANESARIRMNNGDEAVAERCDLLKERLDAIICKAAGGVSPIWLTEAEYLLAMDSVRWAAEQRNK